MDDRRCLVWRDSRAYCKVSCGDRFGLHVLTLVSTIAGHVAKATSADKVILIDCFAGVGGNAIAFARSARWKRVYAIEKDPRVLACAKHNAEIYGVQDRITWYEGDCFDILRNELAEICNYSIFFASPPWGGKPTLLRSARYTALLTIVGPGYRSDTVFNLAKMQPYTLTDLLTFFRHLTRDVALYLPRSSDVRQLANESFGESKMTVIHYCIDGASKVSYFLIVRLFNHNLEIQAICAYYGSFTF